MKDLTKGNIRKHIFDLTLPTLGGMIAFSLFNITDTYFVSKLGTDALAAMGFTFPVIMIAGAISTGTSIGAASLLSRAYGNKNKSKVQRIATDGILLSIILVTIVSLFGLLSMDVLFTFMGADEAIIPLIKSYMTIWYSSLIVVMMPPVSDGAMRAIGDTMRPFKIMLTCALLNIILDPILIFGWFGIPALGIKGAAIATVISRFVGMIGSLYFNHHIHNLIDWSLPKLKDMLLSWLEIIAIGIPSIGVVLLPQIIRVILTSLAAYTNGTGSVAAVAIGSRIGGFSLIIAMAIGSSIVPIVGQNFGSKNYKRVLETQKFLSKLAIITSLCIFIIMLMTSKYMITLFTNDLNVINLSFTYLLIVTLGSIGLNLYNFNSQVLNALGLSKKTFIINASGTLGIILPLMFIGAQFSFVYMLIGLAVGQTILGIISTKVCAYIVVQNIQSSTSMLYVDLEDVR